MSKIRVLIIDDAVVVRRIVSDVLSADPDIEVVGTAANGKIGLAKLSQVNPDIVTMDVEMPEMDGPTTLRELRKVNRKIPVIMFSTLTSRGATAALDCLAAGANDYVTKPANVGSVATAMQRIRDELIPKLKGLCGRHAEAKPAAATASTAAYRPRPTGPRSTHRGPIEAVVIGVSTGGPNALAEVIPALPADLGVPVLIVQHMPPVFTKVLADRLNAKSALRVKEAERGDVIQPNTVYIAPGDFHLTVGRHGTTVAASLNQEMPENSCRPAADVLMRSVAATYGSATLGLVLTGMGQDGMRGCQAIHDAGGAVFIQDEASSVVWGMAGAVARQGLADAQLPLAEVANEIARRVRASRGHSTSPTRPNATAA